MGITLRKNAQFEASIKSFKKALKIQPDYAEAYVYMSASLDEQGKFDAAIASCNQALGIINKVNINEAQNAYRISFRYLSGSGIVDQTFYSFETDAESMKKAEKVIKDILDGGIKIRIDRIIDLSPKKLPNLFTRMKDNFKNKNKFQIILFIFGTCMLTLGALAKFLNRNLNF